MYEISAELGLDKSSYAGPFLSVVTPVNVFGLFSWREWNALSSL